MLLIDGIVTAALEPPSRNLSVIIYLMVVAAFLVMVLLQLPSTESVMGFEEDDRTLTLPRAWVFVWALVLFALAMTGIYVYLQRYHLGAEAQGTDYAGVTFMVDLWTTLFAALVYRFARIRAESDDFD